RPAAVRKSDCGCVLAAALAYLVLQQPDSVGLVTFDDQLRKILRPLSRPSYLKEIVQVLNQGAAREKTRLGSVFHDLAERIPRRALVIVLSDLFDEVPEVLAGLKHLRFKRHEVVVFHVLDRAEVEFPFQEATLFRGLEQVPGLLTDPRSLRRSYLAHVKAFVAELRRGCRTQNVDF